ncbi:DUF177 domain-containing protein [bacterium]|nr:DUF177 domain-containing protein [bacterium]
MRMLVEKLLAEPGAEIHETFRPKPEELGDEDLTFAKAPIRVEVDLQSAGRDILGRLEVDCRLKLECALCLEAFSYAVNAQRQVRYLQNPTDEQLEAELDGWFVSQFDGETVFLDEDVRQILLLSIPLRQVCREDCRGLCARCGANLNRGDCGCPRPASSKENPLRDALEDIRRRQQEGMSQE